MTVYLILNKLHHYWKSLLLAGLVTIFLSMTFATQNPKWVVTFFFMMMFYIPLSVLWNQFNTIMYVKQKITRGWIIMFFTLSKTILYILPFIVIYSVKDYEFSKNLLSWEPAIITLGVYLILLIFKF